MLRHVMFTLLLILTLSACASLAQPTPLTPVTVQLSWTHQAQFAGFYAADQNKYYLAEGLQVTFLEGDATVDLLAPVLNGTAQFGVTNADALIVARADASPLRAITIVNRRSPGVYMALASSGIRRPQDFVGKTIQVGRRGIPRLYAMTTRAGVRPDQYTVVEQTADLMPFYSGKIHVRGAALTNEVLTAQTEGYKLNIIYPDDYGIHFFGEGIFTTDDLIAKNPDLVRRFLRATLKGWTFAIENPTAVGPMVLKYKPNADVKHEYEFMIASIPLVNTGEDHIGWMKSEMWAGMEKTLREQGMLTKTVTITDVYTMQFLNEIYPSR